MEKKTLLSEKLAIEGGNPVREKPLPPEFPGTHFFNEKEIQLVNQVLKARSPFRFYGPDLQNMCKKFEDAFKKRIRTKYALGVSSGTEAIYTSLAALGVGPGDEVLLPGYLWTSCLNGVVRLGAIPRLIDIDDTFTMSPVDLEKKIGPNSKVVMLVHISGAPGNVDDIVRIARSRGLKIIEDCAQSNGAKYKGKYIGSFGDIGIYSLQINKNITAGEGGIIVCNDDYLYKRCFAVHDLGYARSDEGRLLDTCEDEDFQLWGAGARMSELTGALALAQLSKIDDITNAMRNSKWKIRKRIENIPGLSFRKIPDPEGDSGPYLISIYRNNEVCRRFTEALKAEGIRGEGYSHPCLTMEEWGVHWYFNNKSLVNKRSFNDSGWPWTLSQNAFSKNYSYAKGTLPVCDDLSSRSSLLMIPSCLSEQDVDDVVHAFQKVAKHII